MAARPSKRREAPKAAKEFEAAYAEVGLAFPPNLDNATGSSAYWGLPPGSFVFLDGATDRQLWVLVLLLKGRGGLAEVRPDRPLLLHLERGLAFTRIPPAGVCTTCVPRMRVAVLATDRRGLVRLSWLSPCEVFRLMGAPLEDICAREVLAELPHRFSATEMMLFAGQGFHLQSVVAFLLACLVVAPRP